MLKSTSTSLKLGYISKFIQGTVWYDSVHYEEYEPRVFVPSVTRSFPPRFEARKLDPGRCVQEAWAEARFKI
jgi:hypothetical protein